MGNQNKKVIVIAGPTAVGKTSFAIEVAKFFNTEIISADSRQLFSELNIGVARPTKDELEAVPHHFIATESIHNHYDAGMYANAVDTRLTQLFEKHDTVVMAGGTGLYIRAALEGLDALPSQNKQVREQLAFLYANQGLDAIQTIAKSLDVSETKVDFSNPQRLMRAIEIEQSNEEATDNTKQAGEYTVDYYYINRLRSELYDRINKRVDIMLDQDFEKEAQSLIPHRNLNALRTVGYTEFFNYFDGEWTRDFAIEKMKQHTRNYAKRQLTWFRNQGKYKEIGPDIELFLNILKLG